MMSLQELNEGAATKWIRRKSSRQPVRVRLFCFPPAGAGASLYRNWPARLPPTVEVCAIQPPGRETRIRECPAAHLSEMAECIATEITALNDVPFAIFGHSMGGLVGFETALSLQRSCGSSPVHIYISSAFSPQSANLMPALYNLPDLEFMSVVERYGLLPREVCLNSELMEILRPLLQADLKACEGYRPSGSLPVSCPLTIIGAMNDDLVSVSDLTLWKNHTTGPFSIVMRPGQHQLDSEAEGVVINIIKKSLELST